MDVNATIDDVVKLLSHSLDRRITVRRSLDAEPSTILGDPGQLQNALLNLGVNARDAMPDGGELRFTTRRVSTRDEIPPEVVRELADGTYVEIRVSDTGQGMDRETLSHVFEPFFTTKDVGKGTGLGLSMMYGMVKDHGGAVSVESEPNVGTSFRLYFPAADVPTGDDAAPERAKVVRGSGRILVVDDEPVVRRMVSEMLRAMGYEVTAAGDGLHALDLFRERPDDFDLVILDMIMPRMNGLDTFAAMREISPSVRAIVCSGYSLGMRTEELLKDGVLAFLQKPFRAVRLSRVVADCIRRETSA